MDMNLRPLSYDELCQMEFLHVANSDNNRANTIASNNSTTTATVTATPTTPMASGDATLLPIMVIPTSILAANGGVAAAPATAVAVATLPTNCVPENYYQLLAATQPAVAAAAYMPQAAFLLTPNNKCQQLYETSHLSQRPTATAAAALPDESDFEGSECGASVSSASNCIPHFRFNACGMMLQPMQQQPQQQQQHQQRHHTDDTTNTLIGCAPFSHMMGSFGALQSSRLMGNLVGVGAASLSGTLGRNRRSSQGGTQKRVSFKADLVPPEQMLNYAVYCQDWTHGMATPTTPTSTSTPTPPPPPPPPPPPVSAHALADAYHNVMHFDAFMDYQVRKSTVKY